MRALSLAFVCTFFLTHQANSGTVGVRRLTRLRRPSTVVEPEPIFDATVAPKFLQAQANTNLCPNHYSKIKTEAECEAAAIAIGKTFIEGRPLIPTFPSGCFFVNVNGFPSGVAFNTHGTGAPHTNANPVCVLGEPEVEAELVVAASVTL